VTITLYYDPPIQPFRSVAYKRFGDMVPLAVDHEILRGLEGGIEKAVFDGLGLGGGHTLQRAKELLQEPISVVTSRNQLRKKRERLDAGELDFHWKLSRTHLGLSSAR
jgi:hypothetical protein